MHLRDFTINDYEELRALWESEKGLKISSVDEKAKIQELVVHSPGLSIVAEKEKSIIGAVLASQDTRRAYIHHLVVKTQFRNQGIGNALMKEIEMRIAARGIPKAHLFILSENHGVREFYEKRNWQKRTDIIIMSKDLE